MDWIDVASIVFVCVTANHLGLIGKVEEIVGKLPVINCPKCLTCWSVLAYLVVTSHGIITSLAISFLASYVALWLELFEGYIDTLYLKLYDKITSADNDNEATTDAGGSNSASSVP